MNTQRPEVGFLRFLRAAGLIAVLVGALGSISLWFHASKHPPLLLVVLFIVWVLSPFVVLILAHALSKRWSVLTRAALYCVMLLITLGSLTIYVHDALRPRTAQPAFVYVLVAPMSWLLIAMVVPIAALISHRLK